MSYLNKIKNSKEAVLKGEIGALLHDIGKLHPDFIKKQSLENIKGSHHAKDIDKFINSLVNLFKSNKLKVKLGGEEKTVYDFVRWHHDHNAKGDLLEYLKKCDRKDSADDKGIVRKKQSIENTIIASPLGYPKEKIELNCLQKRFDDLKDNLIGLFKNYIFGTIDLSCFRESLINNLKASFSHALGETRIPANDVTLWDHSYSTASLFKSVLASMVCGANINNKKPKWRVFGICWNGMGFINKGRKIAEIQARNEIIESIKKELKRKFEDEIPVGNVIYEDTNGIYFTFPDLNDKSENLAKECAKEALKIIYAKSHNELWPFFTLSKASETLTIIANELKFASEKRKTPKITPTLFVKSKNEVFFENPEIATPAEGQDICPICRIRPKNTKKERCNVCEERRKGRLLQWLLNRQNTIWIDEVADKNNRIALISLDFYLNKWLNGAMIRTIYSQSFEDWFYGEKKKNGNNIKSTTKLLKDAGVNDIIQPTKETIYFLLSEVLKNLNKKKKNLNKKKAAEILDTFFPDVNITKSPDQHLENIKEKIGVRSPTKEDLAAYLFTQNPSPARLYRIWRETEEFFDLVIKEVKNKIYSNEWKRIKFSVTKLKSKLNQGNGVEENTPYIVQIDNLEPQRLLVFHNKDKEFYTIESLEKFTFKDKDGEEKTGEEAVKEALKQGFKHLTPENNPDKNLLHNKKIKPDNDSVKIEKYYPLIKINKSPLSLRLMTPALDSMKVIELVTKLYNERFEKVLGKLPLNVKLLVTKRKFPLYILLDSENRMLKGKEFKKQVPMNVWWNVNGMRNDKYYGFYPTKSIKENEKYFLDDLSSISKGKIFYLYPGYFDFDLLLGTIDRYNICYKRGKRSDEDYKLFTGRPYYFYQISKILELWDVLSNLSSSQINFIEEMLTSKLREWRNIEDGNKRNVFREFAEATLKDAFGNKWNGLEEETRFFLVNSAINGLLLDMIILFRHVIKN